jgi:hypothetical protein
MNERLGEQTNEANATFSGIEQEAGLDQVTLVIRV